MSPSFTLVFLWGTNYPPFILGPVLKPLERGLTLLVEVTAGTERGDLALQRGRAPLVFLKVWEGGTENCTCK